MLRLWLGSSVPAASSLPFTIRRLPVLLIAASACAVAVWLSGSRNPYTPAGPVGAMGVPLTGTFQAASPSPPPVPR